MTKLGVTEFRFGGSLGFGGKCYINAACLPNSERAVRVSNYKEHETHATRLAILAANERLKRIDPTK